MAGSGGDMSFWDHLEELRACIFRSALVVVAISVVCFCCKHLLFDILVLAPTRPDFFLYRLLHIPLDVTLVNISVSAQFFIHLRMACYAGVILGAPYLLYEIWRFIAPALYEREKGIFRMAFFCGGVLFYVGVAVAYLLIVPLALQFFLSYSLSAAIVNTISIESYISLFLSTVLAFGLVFEFPIVVVILSSLGLISREGLRKYRRHALVVILIVAAIITPADPLSMLIAAVPLILLWEVSLLFCRKSHAVAQ